MTSTLPRKYHRLAPLTYDVRTEGVSVGTVWRTRHGWSATTPDGRTVTEDYPGSRDVPAGLLIAAAREVTA